ncbi:malate synthase A [Deinococcus cellulosilyticus]|uniref:Malate synthase n=1 Tax=Deinococcus cellulosilyticus (strain DSM 18568 / NBRC 106333 / KACC 11606 / 5516J-15) TaxID=1223518 RepID=A0A511N3K0_DEIC1|nr:malate synthase A [Deinococcus cellulosilyticus]GEM47057.1 malate synthase [Deinococcus cellulosilyticus NBRC 106333 = KACC 11606]
MTQTQWLHTPRLTPQQASILTPEALEFIFHLERRFGSDRKELLAVRAVRQREIEGGKHPTFLSETRFIREKDWQIAPLPQDLLDRRVEITGPVDRKMIINALNSGAKVFMADFEDASSPTWENCIQGQINLRDAVRRTITFEGGGKTYRLNETPATLKVRPRGLHLEEKHVMLMGQPISGSLFDFGIFLFHNAKELLRQGSGPYFYLPKLESHREARWWNEVFLFAQEHLGLPRGTIKATVLIETILAAFEMDEILYELREHSAGLNCGRWDYIFSIIKKFRHDPDFVMPDRAKVTMATPMMTAYSRLAIQTCHKRGAPAIGGMSAFIPVKHDETANQKAFEQVRLDKEREALNGHDGTWVAHPGLVPVALEVFDRLMPAPNQIHKQLPDLEVTPEDLLTVPTGDITDEGVKTNISVGLQYLAAWLQGAGAVPIHNLMEDAATAEISRAQLWQWIHHQQHTQTGRKITLARVNAILQKELAHLKALNSRQAKFLDQAAKLYLDLLDQERFEEFLTLKGYQLLA